MSDKKKGGVVHWLTAKRKPEPDRGAALPPPRLEESQIKIDQPSAKPSAQLDRIRERSEVFSTRVSIKFLTELDEARTALAAKENRPLSFMSRPQFLERMLALWNEQNGGKQTPFGLSNDALRLVDLIGNHLQEPDIGKLLEEALAGRAVQLKLL